MASFRFTVLSLATIATLSLLAAAVKANEEVPHVGEAFEAAAQSSRLKVSPPVQTGTASWYGGHFIGGKTANGERYRANDMTAAHRKLPFGTFVRVTNLKNDRSVVVRINNRGPFTKGRILDLSKRAAVDLSMIRSGTARVRIEVLAKEVAAGEIAALGTQG